jgi:hypothetical protein
MLRKLIEIDMKHSDLSKRRCEPVTFKIRKSAFGKRISSQPSSKPHLCPPQLQMNKKSRIDELREIAHGNFIMMKKLQEVKPSYEARQLEKDSNKQFKLSNQLSRNGTKYIKNPFFVTDNPAETLFRKLQHSGHSALKAKQSRGEPVSTDVSYDALLSRKDVMNMTYQDQPSHKPSKKRRLRVKKSGTQSRGAAPVMNRTITDGFFEGRNTGNFPP